MEGGWHSWKIQRIEDNSPDLDSYGRPLPPPPPGYYWERLEDKSWELRQFKLPEIADMNMVEFKAPTVIEHVVMDSDTLQGLCLRYNVSAVTLRQYNNFSGNSFRYKKYLRIPVEPGMSVAVQQNSRDVILQRFKCETNEPESEAKCYLEDSNWDLDQALRTWRGDEVWQKDQPPLAVPVGRSCVAPTAVVVPVAAATLSRQAGYIPPRYTPLNVGHKGDEHEVEPLLILDQH